MVLVMDSSVTDGKVAVAGVGICAIARACYPYLDSLYRMLSVNRWSRIH